MSPIARSLTVFVAISATAAIASGQPSHQHPGPAPQDLGSVTFQNSCAPGVQDAFGRGVAALHSFWYEEAERQFQDVAKADPECAMAWWGVAFTQWHPLWEVRGPNKQALARGREAVQRGLAAKHTSPRERAYLEALAKFFVNFDTVDHEQRVKAFESKMAALHETYPQDSEGATFYALSLLAAAAALPPDRMYQRQFKAGEVLAPVFREQPNHPGVAHYIIHAYDYPPLASEALDAARRYSKIAPGAPHALHMPSHIFTRLGLWEDSIASNRNVVAAARKHNVTGEELHGRDYMVFAHLQRGEDRLAREVIDSAPSISQLDPESSSYFAGIHSLAAMPARYVVERRQWAEAAALPDPKGLPGQRYAWADAATYFARALGAARSGKVDQARRDLEKMRTAHKTLVDLKEDYWAGQVDVQRKAAEAWVIFAEGKHDEALKLAYDAATQEGTADKHPVTPGNIVPARDLLGQMLLEMKRPGDALVEFLKVIDAEPNRFSAVYGGAKAAELAGQSKIARELYQQLLKIAPESQRPEVQQARKFLART
jgi:tetratricopeptide (TPR) repeat protein